MSGGVDSSVAAALLQKQGYEVIGLTMCFNIDADGRRRPSCCGIEGIEDARRVAARLKIPHYVVNFGKLLEEKIVKEFCVEYLRGRTPNPCVRCNQYLKFDALLNKARQLDAGYLATGHYARIVFDKKSRQYLLKKGRDKQKEQSYFLYAIAKKTLPRILLPLGNLTKNAVRQLAKEFKLPVADKPGSQEICFIDGDYRQFLKEKLETKYHLTMQPGPILDQGGQVLGRHQGIAFYTIGQREGLGIALGYPAYVTAIDAKKNALIIGKEAEVFSRGLIAKAVNWLITGRPAKVVETRVKIRYNHREAAAQIIPLKAGRLKIIFRKPQRAITPGQSAVFYKRDIVLGGAVIERSLA